MYEPFFQGGTYNNFLPTCEMTHFYDFLLHKAIADKSCNRQFKTFFTHDQISLNYVHFQINSIIFIDDKT